MAPLLCRSSAVVLTYSVASNGVRLFVRSIYKWVQAPISLHIGNLDLDRERALQLPVVTRAEWTVAAAGSDAGVAESQNGRVEVEMPVRAARDG